MPLWGYDIIQQNLHFSRPCFAKLHLTEIMKHPDIYNPNTALVAKFSEQMSFGKLLYIAHDQYAGKNYLNTGPGYIRLNQAW